MKPSKLIIAVISIASVGLLVGEAAVCADPRAGKDLAHQIFDTMVQHPGIQPEHRIVHAKGIVCQGTFVPSPEGVMLCRAGHFHAASAPVTVRFSDAPSSPETAEGSSDANPRGMAIRFTLPGGEETDIVAFSHNGFIVGTGEDFLLLQKAIVATDPTKPHPWPIEAFISTHPRAMKFAQETHAVPESFATTAYFGNNAFVFVNKDGKKQAGRYQILPDAGRHDLSDDEAKGKPASFLLDDIKARVVKNPAVFHLVVQLPNPGDPTNDASLVWPDDRKTIDLGTISISSIVADNAKAEKSLAFDPTNLTDGIELSDDPLPALRSKVYALAAKYRHAD